MSNIKSIIIVSFLWLFSSCNKEWLEKKYNETQAIPTTLKDFQALLDNTLFMNDNLFSLGEISADGHYVTEIVWNSATSNAARNAYTWSNNFVYKGQADSWEYIYFRIFHSNVVLDGLLKTEVPNEEKENWNNIKGQALFNRAISFFNLSQHYAQPYNIASAASDMGIPLRLNADVTESSQRATVAQTYNQIINDTKEAIELLPETPKFPTRAGKPAAYALLARVYLVMGDYDNALLNANKCLQLHNSLLDYNTISASTNFIGNFNSTPKNTEIIFFDRMKTTGYSNFLTASYLVEKSFFDLYTADDLRRTRFFRVNASTGVITFKGNYNSSTSALFSGIATDEVYLIRAECYARKGKTTEAMNDFNTLLEKRFSPFTSYTANDPEKALVKILQERRKELVLRNLRWSDLKRLNQDDRFKITLTRTIGGQTYTLEPNSFRYTFPIPADILAISSIPQSLGW